MPASNLPSSPTPAHPSRSLHTPARRWCCGPFGLLFALALVWSTNCSPEAIHGEKMTERPNTKVDASETPFDAPPAERPDRTEALKEHDTHDTHQTPEPSETLSDTPERPERSETPDTPDNPDAPVPVEPRLLALDKDGKIASLQLTTPWTVLSSGDLKQPTASARCFAGRCLVVHPSPADSISVVDPLDLSKTTTIKLEAGADPRDVAFIDKRTVIVSQYGKSALLRIDLITGTKEPIELGTLADADGIPEALRMARCGRRVFVQLLRVDHTTSVPDAMGAAIAVLDVPLKGSPLIVDTDPTTAGTQPIKLTGHPNFDMPVDCTSGVLYIAEPRPLMKGGGWYEQVDLKTLRAGTSPIQHGAEVGGFAIVTPKLYWLITHTATGPAGNSSHLNLVGGPVVGTYNTFADKKVDELILDPQQDLLFFPDNCVKSPQNQQCVSGVHVFHSRTGAALPKGVISLGFAPMEVAISR